MKRIAFVFTAAALCIVSAAAAAPVVDLGNYSVQAGKMQTISINVSDSGTPSLEDIEGMNLKLQIAAGTGSSPAIASIDLLTGTVWSAIVTPSDIETPTGGNFSQYMLRDFTTTNAGQFVHANGLLATVTIDATSAAPGTYAFDLTSSKDPASDSQFFNGSGIAVPATFGNGSITVTTTVPEPASASLLLLSSAMLLRRRRSSTG